MSLVLLGVAGALLVAPAAAGRWSRGLPPRDRAAVTATALGGGALALEAGLLTLAAPTALRAVGWSGLAHACERTFRLLLPGGPIVGWLAAAGAVGVAAGAARGALRALRLHRRARIEPWLGQHHPGDDFELVILPTAEPVAYSLGGRRPQVVVSVGLVDALTPRQRAAVLRHEASHLRHRHHRTLVAASALDHAVGLVPGVRAGTASLRNALERWADEDASGRTPGSRSCLRSALLASAHALAAPQVAAFGGLAVLAERADALRRPAPSASVLARTLAWGGLATAGLVGLVALGLWVGEVRSVLAMAGYCVS